MKRAIFAAFVAAVALVCACGDDNSDGSGGSTKGRVDSAVSSADGSYREYIDHLCSCYSEALGHNSASECVQERYVPTETTSCQRTAAACDIDSFERFYACQGDAFDAYKGCLQSCPMDGDAIERCSTEFESSKASCNSEVSQALADAIGTCEQGATPDCGGSGGGSGNNGGGGCIERQAFVDHVYGKAWDVYYYAGSGGAIDCKDDEACIREQYLIAPDGSYALHYMIDPDYTDYDDYLQQVCTKGTWTLSCDQITFEDCRGSDTYTLQLTSNGFKLGAKTFDEASFFVDPSDASWCTSRPCGWD